MYKCFYRFIYRYVGVNMWTKKVFQRIYAEWTSAKAKYSSFNDTIKRSVTPGNPRGLVALVLHQADPTIQRLLGSIMIYYLLKKEKHCFITWYVCFLPKITGGFKLFTCSHTGVTRKIFHLCSIAWIVNNWKEPKTQMIVS